jgi:hypothetical protein
VPAYLLKGCKRSLDHPDDSVYDCIGDYSVKSYTELSDV